MKPTIPFSLLCSDDISCGGRTQACVNIRKKKQKTKNLTKGTEKSKPRGTAIQTKSLICVSLEPQSCPLATQTVTNCVSHSNSNKRKHLIRAGLQIQGFNPFSTWWEAWRHVGRCGAGEGAKSSAAGWAGSRK